MIDVEVLADVPDDVSPAGRVGVATGRPSLATARGHDALTVGEEAEFVDLRNTHENAVADGRHHVPMHENSPASSPVGPRDSTGLRPAADPEQDECGDGESAMLAVE